MSEEVTVKELDDLCKMEFQLRQEKDEVNKKLSDVNKKITDVQSKILAYFEQTDKTSYVVKDYGTYYKKVDFTVTKPTGDDKLVFFADLKEKGLFDGMADIHAARLQSYVATEIKLQMEAGVSEPKVPGIKEFGYHTKLNFRKAN